MGKAVVVLYNKEYPAKEVDSNVDIYRSIKPTRPYIEIGEISCNLYNKNKALTELKIKARSIGADGLIILGHSVNSSAGNVAGGIVVSSGESYGYNAIAIRYKD